MTRQLSRVLAGLLVATLAGPVNAHWELLDTPVELIRAGQLKAGAELGAPRCGATGDLDGDGVLDLVTGHPLGQVGAIVVYHGNADFRQGLRRDLWRSEKGLPPLSAFDERAVVLEVPFAPHWLAIGDLDGNERSDIACAAREQNRIAVLSGTADGGYSEPLVMPLPGPVAAFAAGDVNRGDTLMDLVVAIDIGGGGAVLVFEHPAGALQAEPEWHQLDAPASDIALGRLDDDPWTDIAVAADDVVVIFGRDRRLAEKAAKRQRVAPASMEAIDVKEPAHDLVFGHFTKTNYRQLAVRRSDGILELVESTDGRLEHTPVGEVTPPVASTPGLVAALTLNGSTDDLVIPDKEGAIEVVGISAAKSGTRSLEKRGVIDAPAQAVIAARLNRDARDDLLLLDDGVAPRVAKTMPRYVFSVNSTADTDDGSCTNASCTLREAINAVNGVPTASGIVMDLDINAVITPASYLRSIDVSNLVIDGTVGSGPVTSHLRLDGSSCNHCDGLSLNGNSATVTTIAFGNFDDGYVGTGINITSDNNLVAGCLVGLDTLSNPTPNHNGISISTIPSGSGNIIGGSTAADRNVVSGNEHYGVALGAGGGNDNRVIGNFVGTDRSGGAARGNGDSGIIVAMGGWNFVGTALAGEGNVVAGNAGDGIKLSLGSPDVSSSIYVLHNLVGVAADGLTPLANAGVGIHVNNQRNVTIGGYGVGPRNVAAADSDSEVIVVEGDSAGTVIRGNYISLGSDGSTALPPADEGILVTSSEVTVGGTLSGYGNVIGPHGHFGVAIGADTESVTDCDVLGNIIGTDVAQQSPLLIRTSGVSMRQCSGCAIGDPAEPESGNIIVAVGTHDTTQGIRLLSCTDVQVARNRIGETGAGLPMGGGGTGVHLDDTTDSQIGWGNIIAYNGAMGIAVRGVSSGILMATNSIHSNDKIGIDLGNDWVTPNDPGDSDSGPNNLQNYPVITGHDPVTGIVTATLDSDQAMTTYTVQLYEVPVCDTFFGHSNGEGETFLGALDVLSDGSGDANITMYATVTPGWFLTMLASDPDGNTSEFSECFEVAGDPDLIFADGFEAGDIGAWG